VRLGEALLLGIALLVEETAERSQVLF